MLQKLKNWYEATFDDSRWAWFVLPIAICNLLLSKRESKKQWSVFVDAVNESDEFASSLSTLGFTISGTSKLTATYDIDLELSDEQIHRIANQQIAIAVSKFIKDEMLLGIIKAEIIKTVSSEKTPQVQVNIIPASQGTVKLDIVNLIISISVFIVFAIFTYAIYRFVI